MEAPLFTTDSQKSQLASGAANEVKSIADDVTATMCRMLEEGARSRQNRFGFIKKNEDMYFQAPSTALKGRSNIPFDSIAMGGFIDSLLATARQTISLAYGPKREQDKMAADMITAVWQSESGMDRANWHDKLIDTDLLAALSGVGFNKIYFESTPKFKSDLIVCDHYDMITESLGGNNLDKHLYKFQMNIFRSREELLDAGGSGFYNLTQVRKLFLAYSDAEKMKMQTDLYGNKIARYATFGIDIATMGFVGSQIYRLTEGVAYVRGKWYYALFSYEAKLWVRFEPLTEVFAHAVDFAGRGPWTAYHTHPHPFIFWTKGPADDVRPIGYTIKKIVNYTVDNLEKRNWQQRAYNPKMFTDPVQLLWKQDGLVRATLKPNENIQNGMLQFETPDTTSISMNMMTFLDNYLGKKIGVTDEVQGASEADQVGISVQNLQQASKRLTLANDRKKKSLIDLGVMFDYGVYENLREPYAVKIIGIKGAQWEEQVTRRETEREFTITVRAGEEEAQKNKISALKRAEGFASYEKNPTLLSKLNIEWYNQEKLRDMGYDEEQIRVALDTSNDGDADSRAYAAQAIQDCLEGKPMYKMYRGATPGFIEKILNFCADEFDLIPAPELKKLSKGRQAKYKADMIMHDKLLAYAQAHIPIATENMIRKATAVVAASAAAAIAPANPAAPTAKTPPATPAPLQVPPTA